jgi:hypothetical protein
VRRRQGLDVRFAALAVLGLVVCVSVIPASRAVASSGLSERSATLRRDNEPQRKKHKKTPKTTTTTRPPATGKAQVAAYCASVASGANQDAMLFDDAMRPLLTRGIATAATRTADPTLAADATPVLNTITASLSATALAQVPAAIRADVQAVRTEKQGVMQHLISAANGDQTAFTFIVQAESNGGGVLPSITNVATYLQTNCTPPGSSTTTTTR